MLEPRREARYDEDMTTQPHRRWFRFSLLSLFALTTVCAILARLGPTVIGHVLLLALLVLLFGLFLACIYWLIGTLVSIVAQRWVDGGMRVPLD